MSIRIYPSDQAIGEFAALNRFLTQLSIPTETDRATVGNAVRTEFGANFASESSGSGAWPQLAARTRRERRELGYNPTHPILVRSGEYRDSFLSPDAWSLMETTATGWHMEFGSEHPWVLQHEGPRGDGALVPERSVMDLTPTSESRLATAIDAMFMARQVPNAR